MQGLKYFTANHICPDSRSIPIANWRSLTSLNLFLCHNDPHNKQQNSLKPQKGQAISHITQRRLIDPIFIFNAQTNSSMNGQQKCCNYTMPTIY